MPNSQLNDATGLSDEDLLRQLLQLAGREREATVELIVHLAELDTRKLYLGEGYGSLFAYCTEALHLGEHAAFNRIEAARLSRRFPAILDRLADGSLTLSTVRLLGPHLRRDNFQQVVTEATGRSKRAVEVLVARLAPRPDVKASVRRLPQPGRPPRGRAPEPVAVVPRRITGAEAALPGAPATVGAKESESFGPTQTVTEPPERPAHRPEVSPLAPDRFRVQFTIDKSTHDKLRRVQDLLRREIPDGDPGGIFDRALTLLLDHIARTKLAQVSSPAAGGDGGRVRRDRGARSRHIPSRVKRSVWLRDGGRCAFVSPRGRRCTERRFLEFHHREPHAIGGEATEANISLRCRAHNAYEAQLVFGAREPGGGNGLLRATALDGCRGPAGSAAVSDRPPPRAAHLGKP